MSLKRLADAPGDRLLAKKSKPCECDSDDEIESESASSARTAAVKSTDSDHHGAFSSNYHEKTAVDVLKEKFAQQKHTDGSEAVSPIPGFRLHTSPFRCCELPDFIEGKKYIQGLKQDLDNLKFFSKNNDLYKFRQSDDLKKVSKKSIARLREILYGEFRSWLREVTGIPLNDTVDMSCSCYTYTDSLLCHDDELEGRRIAFIYYLVPEDWSLQDGGALDLFSVNDVGDPTDVVKSICPQENKLVFFEVTPASFHQVAEVTSEVKCRLSVSGWFHGPPIERPQPHYEMPSHLEPCLTVDEQLFYQWINPMYLDMEVQGQIQTAFESESEIQLPDFIKPEMYELLLDALQSDDMPWQKRGPANKRSYHTLPEEKYPSVLVNCMQFFRSDAMFVVLSNLTGLSFHELAMNDNEEDDVGRSKEQPTTSENVENNYTGEGSKTEQPNPSENEANNSPSEGSKTEQPSTSENEENNCTGAEGETEKPSTSENVHVEKYSTGEGSKTEQTAVSCPEGDQRESKEAQPTDSSAEPSKSTAQCKGEVRCWRPGCYTLMADTDLDQSAEFALDARFSIGCEGWQTEFGGYTSYIVKDEDEELLTVIPTPNSLALVYRDGETLQFVKYINDMARQLDYRQFYDLTMVYYE